MTIWVKPNGSEIELNDEPATASKAEELGWKKKGKKRGPKPRDED